jgi:threonine synthase
VNHKLEAQKISNKKMNYYSTNNIHHRVSLKEAVLQGLAPDNGLYMPEQIPALSKTFFEYLSHLSFQEIGFAVAKNLIGDDLPEEELKRIVDHNIQFDAPLVEIEKNIFSLELFHGPTLAFKDFGARFLSGLLGYFANQQEKEITILVATSGDTGSAVANGFYNVPGTRVIVLYPSGKVSEIQEMQFTTLGGNITALEIDGTFDDCQRLVKQAFIDEDLKQKLFLTSANSINIARLIPQSFYYFYAFAQLNEKQKQVVFSIPSGNFGNLTAGLLAKQMGLPIHQFIAATNQNDIVPEYLTTKLFSPRPSVQTISNAMDVGNPSNFARMLDLYENNFEGLSKDVVGCHYSDEQTSDAMRAVFKNKNYTLDPHGAIGYLGLKDYLKSNTNAVGVFLETAHPAKFKETVQAAIGTAVSIPERLQNFLVGKKKSIRMGKEFGELKEFLICL